VILYPGNADIVNVTPDNTALPDNGSRSVSSRMAMMFVPGRSAATRMRVPLRS
jgi:hypothetical protein